MKAAALLLIACACGDDGPTTTIAPQDFQDATFDAACRYQTRCGLFPDVATCRLVVAPPVPESLLPAIEAGIIHWDASAAFACVEGIAAIACNVDPDRNQPIECRHLVSGTLADRASCSLGAECASAYCNIITCPPDACCTGTCAPHPDPFREAQVGEACDGNARCTASYCDAVTQLCTAYGRDGAPCTDATTCDDGYACQAAICTLRPPSMAACTDSCSDVNLVCVRGACAAVRLLGETCDATTAPCSPYFTCDPATHTCVTGPQRGESCASAPCFDTAQSFCAPGLQTCTARLADDSPCIADDDCESAHCGSARTCTHLPTCL